MGNAGWTQGHEMSADNFKGDPFAGGDNFTGSPFDGEGGGTSAAVEPQPSKPSRTWPEAIDRHLDLSKRAIATVALSPLTLGGNILNKTINALAGTRLEMPGDIVERNLDRVFPKAEGGAEQFALDVARGAPAFALPASLPVQMAGNAAINAAMAPPGKEAMPALAGGAGGFVGHALGKTLTGLVTPGRDAAKLIDEGIVVTPGQAAGKDSTFGRIEQAMASNPLASNIQRLRRAGIEEFDARIMEQSVGAPKGAFKGKTPREALEAANERVGDLYGDALRGAKLPAHQVYSPMQSAIMALNPGDYPLVEEKAIEKIGAWVMRRFERQGDTVTGDSIKALDSEVGRIARELEKSGSAVERETARLWRDVQDGLRYGLNDVLGPEKAKILAQANAAHKNLLPIKRALKEGDLAMPLQVRKATERMGINHPSAQLVEAANRTLPGTLPNSGTADRILANAMPALLLGGGAGAQGLGLDTLGSGMMAAGALGTRPGAKLLTGQYPWQRAEAMRMMAQALRGGVPSMTRPQQQEENGE